MKINEFIEAFRIAKPINNKINEHAVEDYIRETLEVKEYIPFREKRQIAEMIVKQNISIVDGVKKNDSIGQYISFVASMLAVHTNLEFESDVVADYDILAESGLLPIIISTFKPSYDECDILCKMALADELEDNNLNIIVGKFLNGILDKLDVVTEALGDKINGFNIESLFEGIKKEDLTALGGLLDRYK